ncbi:MAG: DUF4446 family protein [Candidatus Paceibacterota bacterium]
MTFFTDPNNLFYGFIILAILNIILLGVVIWMYTKIKRFLIGSESHNIADSLTHTATSLKDLEKFQDEMESYLADVENRLKKSVRSVHTVRFNPFKGIGEGGKQSFATAFVNEEGDGVVLSSLYSRDRVSVFSKPIKTFSSEHELSDEEMEALEKAKLGLK